MYDFYKQKLLIQQINKYGKINIIISWSKVSFQPSIFSLLHSCSRFQYSHTALYWISTIVYGSCTDTWDLRISFLFPVIVSKLITLKTLKNCILLLSLLLSHIAHHTRNAFLSPSIQCKSRKMGKIQSLTYSQIWSLLLWISRTFFSMFPILYTKMTIRLGSGLAKLKSQVSWNSSPQNTPLYCSQYCSSEFSVQPVS